MAPTVRIRFPLPVYGRVTEWFIVLVLKTSVPKGTVGSNPTSSANFVSIWKDDRVAYRSSLLKMRIRKGSGGSNPSPSANLRFYRIRVLRVSV